MNDAPYHGWFSQKSVDTGNGTCIYRRADGTEFEISVVAQDPDYALGWEDAVYLGVVGKYDRQGRPGIKNHKLPDFGKLPLLHTLEPVKGFDGRLMKVIPLKYTTEQIQKILEAADVAGFISVEDDDVSPCIIIEEKKS